MYFSQQEILMYCLICRTERSFIRVVEAHIEMEQITIHSPVFGAPRQWVRRIELPLAYCSSCKVVVYIGPSAEEIQKSFEVSNLEKIFA